MKMNIQGTDGIGKSTFASNAEDVIFLQAEDGLKFIEAPRFPVAETWEDLLNQVRGLANEEHAFKTVCLDTTDAASILAERQVCEKKGYDSIESPGFGKGHIEVKTLWTHMLDGLQWLYQNKKMNVILLSHVHVKPFNDAINEPYDRWEMRCHKQVNALIKDWVDFNFLRTLK